MYISKVEKFRAEYRKSYKNLEGVMTDNGESDPKILENCEFVLAKVKEYVILAKKNKTRLHQNEADEQQKIKVLSEKIKIRATIQKNKTVNFLLNEIDRVIIELKNECRKTGINVDDEELMRQSKNLPKNKDKFECLSKKLQHILEVMPGRFPDSAGVITATTDSYDELLKEMSRYESFIKSEMQKRESEIIKGDKFKSSVLNIKLSKFKGYDSELDFFTFKSQFEKLYIKCTPLAVLPDLLKNNYLQEPALSLVKRLDIMDDIWSRFQKAYGDPRIMLKNKLADVKKIGPLWKLKGVERIEVGLATLLNLMSDLLKLSKEHGIEQKLYHGEALDIIYTMMGDARVTKWLSTISDEEGLAEGDLWERLVKFLERE